MPKVIHRGFRRRRSGRPLRNLGRRKRVGLAGFTLVELLVVVGIIIIMIGLMVPAFNALKGSGDITKAAHDVSGAIQTARAYAMANNTYTWLGFFEEDPTKSAGTAGIGRVIMSIVSSKDGTQIVDPSKPLSDPNNPPSDPNTPPGDPNLLDPLRLAQVGKLIKVDNIHLVNFEDGSGDGQTFDQRPIAGKAPFPDKYARIGDTSPPTPAKFPLQYPVGGTKSAPAAQYTFTKLLQFNPRGESSVNGTYALRPIIEVGLQPARGNAVDANNKNVVAVQVTGIAGNVKIYQR